MNGILTVFWADSCDFNTCPIICDVHQRAFGYYNVIIMKLYNDSVIIFEEDNAKAFIIVTSRLLFDDCPYTGAICREHQSR